jgi:hypothetical protein
MSKIPADIEPAIYEAPREGAYEAGTVFTDGHLDDVRSVSRRVPEALHGVPAVSWRGVDPEADRLAREAARPKRGRPKKVD